MSGKKWVAATVAEIMGVVVLATAVYSMVARTSFPFFSGLAAGVVAGLLVLTIGVTSGAHVNPAITFGLWTVRKTKTVTALVYIIAQMLAGFAALQLLNYFMGKSLDNTAGAFAWKAFWGELIGALIFGFGVASAVYQKYEGGKLAFAVGGSLTIGILVASMGSNGVVNPAVALGLMSVNVAYLVAPLIGSAVGMNLYALLFSDETLSARAVAAGSKPGRSFTVRSLVPSRNTSKAAPARKTVAKKKTAAKKRR